MNLKDQAFFTICSKNFLAHARALHKSIRQLYPESPFYVALCDRIDGDLDPLQEPFEFVYLSDINFPGLERMSREYNITEFNTSIKPFVFLYLMQKMNLQYITYLDPDLYFVSRMDELDDFFMQGAEAVLTPHVLEPAEEGEVQDRNFLLSGIYNLGFLSLKNTPDVQKYLKWWGRKLEKECIIDLQNGLFVDQKWCDLLPAYVKETRILHHPGYNVAYWNLAQRQVSLKDGLWSVNGFPLRFVHFSGNALDQPNVFSRHSVAITIQSIGDLKELLDEYREEVFRQGHNKYRRLSYAFSWGGKHGVNLHTPQELDQSGQSKEPSVGSKERINGVLYAIRVFGGMGNLLSRVMGVYRQGGIKLLRQKTTAFINNYSRRKLIHKKDFNPSSIQSIHSVKWQPRILHIDWSTPRPDQDAGSVTAFNLLKIYVELGFCVTFIPSDLAYCPGYTESLRQLGVKCLDGESIDSVATYLQKCGGEYDYVFLARGPIADLHLPNVKKYAPQAKVIFHTSDLHYLRLTRQAEVENKPALLKEAEKLKKMELSLIRKSDASIILSEHEMRLLDKEGLASKIHLIPLLFIDRPEKIPAFKDRKDILFIGGFLHQPNVDAVLYFANKIFPGIREKIQDIKFHIVGPHPTPEVLSLKNMPGVVVHGYVQDITDLFSSIRLTVAPLRYGAGIKGKIGTSLSYAVPVVATPIALEGMELLEENGVIVGDTEDDFARKLVKVYNDEGAWTHLSQNAYKTAIEMYSFEKGKLRITDFMRLLDKDIRLFETVPIYSFSQYGEYNHVSESCLASRAHFENEVTPKDKDSFFLDGFCAVCGKKSSFQAGWMYSLTSPTGEKIINWREHLACMHCGFVTRIRAALHYFYARMQPFPDAAIYITEQVTNLFEWLKQRHPSIVGSEFLGNEVPLGSTKNGVRNEDVTRLTFPDNCFDYVLSFDVLEHVVDDIAALKELFRVLKPGGTVLFSVPFSSSSPQKVVRAKVADDGEIVHLMPPEYHGNPVDPEKGALAFRYFAWDLLDEMRKIGFEDAKAEIYWSKEYAYLGVEQFLFVGRKPYFG